MNAGAACQGRRVRRAACHSGLLQSDKLYLACRGDSVGQVLDKQWAERPRTLVGASLLFVLLVAAWLGMQACKLCGRRSEAPGKQERYSGGADSDSD